MPAFTVSEVQHLISMSFTEGGLLPLLTGAGSEVETLTFTEGGCTLRADCALAEAQFWSKRTWVQIPYLCDFGQVAYNSVYLNCPFCKMVLQCYSTHKCFVKVYSDGQT